MRYTRKTIISSGSDKKNIIAAILMILAINTSIAQTKLGIKLSSSIIHQRVSYQDDTVHIGQGANAFSPSFTLFADIPFSENYYFTTGVGYISKRVNLNVASVDDNIVHPKSYNVQYLTLPATLKLYTNEIALDKKLYLQVGPVFDVALHTREIQHDFKLVESFQPIDVTLLFAGGMEIQMAPQTTLQIGLSYRRGLLSIVKSYHGAPDADIKNDLYGLDLAVKF